DLSFISVTLRSFPTRRSSDLSAQTPEQWRMVRGTTVFLFPRTKAGLSTTQIPAQGWGAGASVLLVCRSLRGRTMDFRILVNPFAWVSGCRRRPESSPLLLRYAQRS